MTDQSQVVSPRHLRVFLCHSSHDKPTVRTLYNRLKACNVDPWFDEEILLPGQDFHLEIQRAVRTSDAVIICLSRGFLVKEGYGQKEIKLALDTALEKPQGTIYLIPLRLEACELPEYLGHLQAVNYFEENGFEKLITALRERKKSLGVEIELIDYQPLPKQLGFPNTPTIQQSQSSLEKPAPSPQPIVPKHSTQLGSINQPYKPPSPEPPLPPPPVIRPTEEASKSEEVFPVYVDISDSPAEAIPRELAQRFYEDRRRPLDHLVDTVIQMKSDGNYLVPRKPGEDETNAELRLRALEKVEKLYREINLKRQDDNPIKQAIMTGPEDSLRDDFFAIILGLRAEQERMKAEIYERQMQQYVVNRSGQKPPQLYIPPHDFPGISLRSHGKTL